MAKYALIHGRLGSDQLCPLDARHNEASIRHRVEEYIDHHRFVWGNDYVTGYDVCIGKISNPRILYTVHREDPGFWTRGTKEVAPDQWVEHVTSFPRTVNTVDEGRDIMFQKTVGENHMIVGFICYKPRKRYFIVGKPYSDW